MGDADRGDPVRITKFGQLWSLRVPSEADSYGVVVAREVGGDGVLRWKVCPIAEENDIASWCEGVERISRSEWLNLLGARDVRERAQPEPSSAKAADAKQRVIAGLRELDAVVHMPDGGWIRSCNVAAVVVCETSSEFQVVEVHMLGGTKILLDFARPGAWRVERDS